MAGSQEARGAQQSLKGLDRFMLVLETLAERPMRAKELAEELDIKWPTAHRTLQALCETGCLMKDEQSGKYRIGPRLYYLGTAYVGSLPFAGVARKELIAAAEETGATAQLVTKYGTRTMNIFVADSPREQVARTSVDYHFPLHCGSKGQVLLAFSSEEFVERYLSEPLVRLTPHTIVDSEALRERLAWIRAHDYALTKGDIQLSTGSVAAPVRDASGAVVASVTLIVEYSRVDGLAAELLDVLFRVTRDISTQIGWRPGITSRTA